MGRGAWSPCARCGETSEVGTWGASGVAPGEGLHEDETAEYGSLCADSAVERKRCRCECCGVCGEAMRAPDERRDDG